MKIVKISDAINAHKYFTDIESKNPIYNLSYEILCTIKIALELKQLYELSLVDKSEDIESITIAIRSMIKNYNMILHSECDFIL